jgi:hypothetical protein
MLKKLLPLLLFGFFVFGVCEGQVIFQKIFGLTPYLVRSFVQQTGDGGYIATGTAVGIGAGGGDVYLIKMNSSGDTLWTKTFGSIYGDEGHSVQQTADGGYIIEGRTFNILLLVIHGVSLQIQVTFI